jgi:hypothetical protein
MSYQIVISGHSNEPHNDDVVKVAVGAVQALQALGHSSVSLSGYSNDSEGAVQLTDALVPSEEEAAPATAEATPEETPEPAAETPTSE